MKAPSNWDWQNEGFPEDERIQLPKLGSASLGFDEQCASYMATAPNLVPPFVTIRSHAGTVDMELRVGVELFHTRGAVERHGQPKQPTQHHAKVTAAQKTAVMTKLTEINSALSFLVNLTKDRALRVVLADILRETRKLCEKLDDTLLLVGSEIWMADLSFYQTVRQAARRDVPGAD